MAEDQETVSEDVEASEDARTPIEEILGMMKKLDVSVDELLAVLLPMEAGQNIHQARRPTLATVKKTPHCVVFVEWDEAHSLELHEPLDRDSQGFDNYDDALAYYEKNVKWAKSDTSDFDGHHLIVLFKDTLDFSDMDYTVSTKKDVFGKDIEKALKSGQIDFIFSGKQKPSALNKTVPTASSSASKKKAVKAKTAATSPASPVKSSGAKKLAAKRAEGKADEPAPKTPTRQRSRKAPVKKTDALVTTS